MGELRWAEEAAERLRQIHEYLVERSPSAAAETVRGVYRTDLAGIYETERHLLYVACTRARDHLLVTGVAPASEFLDDLRGNDEL